MSVEINPHQYSFKKQQFRRGRHHIEPDCVMDFSSPEFRKYREEYARQHSSTQTPEIRENYAMDLTLRKK